MYRDQELMAHIDPAWLDQKIDDLRGVHEKIRHLFWKLRGGWADDWAYGVAKPEQVPNPTMPWERPSFAATVYRQWIFETRPGYIQKQHESKLRRKWYRIFGNSIPVPTSASVAEFRRPDAD